MPQMESQPPDDRRSVAQAVVAQLRGCGHFLYYRMGGYTGRRRLLTTLAEHPDILQQDLQNLLRIRSGSMSEIMIRLESEGLVEKTRSASDGRRWAVRLSPKGACQAQRLKQEYSQQVDRMMACFTLEELQILQQLLDKMFAHWDSLGLADPEKEPDCPNPCSNRSGCETDCCALHETTE